MASQTASPKTALRKAAASKAKHQRQVRKRRRARFNNEVTVTEIPSHRVYSFEERFAVWYSQSEYRCFNLQERIRKKMTANNQTELSDRVIEPSDIIRRAKRANIQKRKLHSSNDDYHNSTKISAELKESLALVVQARNATNRRIAQIQQQIQQHQRLPAFSFHSPVPTTSVSMAMMQAKHASSLPQMPFGFATNHVPCQSNSPVARGA